MPLTTMKAILAHAHARGYAVPSFSAYNLDVGMQIIKTASEMKAPVIVQMYQRLFETDMGRAMCAGLRAAAADAPVPIALHLDHGTERSAVVQAIQAGCTSVMIDASHLPDAENIRITGDVVDMCRAIHVTVEGELGHVGSAADDSPASSYTQPEDAARFVRETGVDALAVMVGTAHGIYKQLPHLDIRRIEAIREATGIHLVLHGGSGVPDDQITAAIAAGVRKINYATDISLALYAPIRMLSDTDNIWTRPIDLFLREPLKSAAAFLENRLALLGACGQAW